MSRLEFVDRYDAYSDGLRGTVVYDHEGRKGVVTDSAAHLYYASCGCCSEPDGWSATVLWLDTMEVCEYEYERYIYSPCSNDPALTTAQEAMDIPEGY